MCGIVGIAYSGLDTFGIIEALKKLEYRGYDSAGICYYNKNDIKVVKNVGNISKLEEITKYEKASIALGHTRWATTGVVSKENCHPHISNCKNFYIIHNGVIENYKELKEKYLKKYELYSQTDTEVIVNLISLFYKNYSLLDSIKECMKVLKGSFSFLVLSKFDPDKIYFAKNKTPLIIGENNKYKMVASDLCALNDDILKYVRLNDYDYGYLSEDFLCIKSVVNNTSKIIYSDFNVLEQKPSKNNYEHYMIKEIFEQISVTKRIEKYFKDIDITILSEYFKNKSKIVFIGAGTSYYASMYSKVIVEKILGIKSSCYLASEFSYYPPITSKDDLYILLSQSGETADVIECAKLIKSLDSESILLTNNIHSTLSSLTNYTLDINALMEISVASTKAYSAMILSVYSLCHRLSNLDFSLKEFSNKLGNLFVKEHLIKEIASKYSKYEKIYYLGRGLDYVACLEGALKLKEISYINCCAYPSGELKHGTLSLVCEDTLVISLITSEKTKDLALLNVLEAKSRCAKELVITNKLIDGYNTFIIDFTCQLLSPLLGVIWFQLFAYYVALDKKLNIDMPRNLAKSVTVE